MFCQCVCACVCVCVCVCKIFLLKKEFKIDVITSFILLLSEILVMCIADFFKLFSCSCAIKTLNLKFLTESKVKKSLYNIMVAKMIDKLEIAYLSFCASHTDITVLTVIIHCHCHWIRRKSRGGKFGLVNGC